MELDDTKPVSLTSTSSAITIGHQTIHHTHDTRRLLGAYYCNKCGYSALQGSKLMKLAEECKGKATGRGKQDLACFHKGRLPKR